MINVTINIESVFAQFNSVDELKEVTNSVVAQVKAAYDARFAELQGKAKDEEKPTEILVSMSGSGEKTTTKPTKTAKQTKKETPKAEKPTKEPVKQTAPKNTKKFDVKTEDKTERKPREEVKQVSISSLTKAQIKAMDIKFEQYSEKCMFLTGDTRCIKDEIMATKGAHWNRSRQGWFVKNDTAKELAKALKIKIA